MIWAWSYFREYLGGSQVRSQTLSEIQWHLNVGAGGSQPSGDWQWIFLHISRTVYILLCYQASVKHEVTGFHFINFFLLTFFLICSLKIKTWYHIKTMHSVSFGLLNTEKLKKIHNGNIFSKFNSIVAAHNNPLTSFMENCFTAFRSDGRKCGEVLV